MSQNSTPDWALLKKISSNFKSRERLKFMFRYPSRKFMVNAISASQAGRKVWELFDDGADMIIIANSSNKILFKFERQFPTENRISHLVDPETITIGEKVIEEWQHYSERTRTSWIEAVLLENLRLDQVNGRKNT